MDRESIKRKIEKLLALSKSTNENEALAAIKAARRLMLKYHISASEEMIENQNKQQVLRKMSKKELRFKRMPLKQHHLVLAGILAKYFRCKSVYHCGEVSKIIFIGFEEDAYAALALLEYLIRFMEQRAGKYAERQNQDCSWREGFCIGVLEALEEQNKSNLEYAVLLTVPSEVMEAFHKLNAKKISVKRRPQSSLDGNVYANGKIRGKQAVDERSLSCKE